MFMLEFTYKIEEIHLGLNFFLLKISVGFMLLSLNLNINLKILTIFITKNKKICILYKRSLFCVEFVLKSFSLTIKLPLFAVTFI